MHGRIFQLYAKPIAKEEYLTESFFDDHWFLREIADYVSDHTDRNEDLKWLSDATDGIEFGKDEAGEYLIIRSKGRYFSAQHKKCVSACKELAKISLSDFASSFKAMRIFSMLCDSFDQRFGFYVVDSYEDVMTLDRFVRACKDGDKFYIGASLDYHC